MTLPKLLPTLSFPRATVLCMALALTVGAASAGPLLDRIKERRAARAESKAEEKAPTTEPSAEQTLEDPNGGDDAPSTVARNVVRDVAYGTDPKQRMDVYLPAKGAALAPVIFMVHGGAWRMGDKRMGNVVDNKVARWVPKGFVFISVNNRLLPEADPLDQVRDVAQALASAQSKATGWGADPKQFILMGHSAGAHLVALLASSASLATQAGAQPWLGTVALDSAALDVAPIMQGKHYKLYDPAFGTDPTFWKAVSPQQQLQSGSKPLLMVCSVRRDESCGQARAFAARATSIGVRVQVLPQDMTHSEINKELGLGTAYTQAVEGFMASLSAPVAATLQRGL
ncbi:alpha/beta hydrolase [Rhodoferax saidenbachensis]|uniref:Acetyl esterase/lipase n=1 Tax=Rhodoferax saidenbachensis TaxID=1484693 RepID=A0ABU1ZI49_9BURK|nr:alpha/beta hydrolase [Rhodoferax saidenbachensis]MDR7305204.1 acetyl esterase/lipase [Rhodoferax saidenbachensis]